MNVPQADSRSNDEHEIKVAKKCKKITLYNLNNGFPIA